MIHFHINPNSISLCFPEFECVVPYAPQIHEIKAIKIQIQKTKDSSSLNRCDTDEVEKYNSLLLGKQKIQIQSVRRKIELLPQRYGDQNYLPQSQILILSPGWSSADRYSCCSVRSSVNPSGQCRLHRFCSYCSYLTGRDVQLEFVPAFDDGNWFFLTGSHRGTLSMPHASSAYEWIAHWELYKCALNYMISNLRIRGYYMIEELAVNSISNVSVLPHIHAIIDADELEEEEVEEAVREVKSLSSAKYEATLPIDVKVMPISNQRSLMDRIRYMFKPINLVKAYENDWRTCENKITLNSNTTDLVLGYSNVTSGRPKMSYKGTLNVKSKQFIGIQKKDRADYKPLLRQLQSEAYQDYIESSEPIEN